MSYQLPVYSCQDVADKFNGVIPLQCGKKYRIGDFTVQPFPSLHNVECYAYLLENDEIGRFLMVTDCYKFKPKLKRLNHLCIEANYKDDIIYDHLSLNEEVRSNNQYHMELEDTIECIKNNMSSELNTLTICHLSDGQSDERMFADRIYDETGIMPKIASKGLIVELNKEEF